MLTRTIENFESYFMSFRYRGARDTVRFRAHRQVGRNQTRPSLAVPVGCTLLSIERPV